MKKHRNWEPSPNDAMAMAAVRWFACAIESYSIEVYATSPATYAETEEILRDTLRKLALLRLKVKKNQSVDEDCPEGYRLCDGICKPACEPEAPPEDATVTAAARSGRRKSTKR